MKRRVFDPLKADVQHICKEPLLNQVNVTIAQDNSSITNCRRKLLRVCRLRGRQQLPLDMHHVATGPAGKAPLTGIHFALF